ncbi:hypothetical protein [Leuconostoc pseudomesenteroides]|uniref:hypothetical protein n=1 Tax=Leuconostoc pseudomesenteroides TaxID=33968 RepID=UPI0011220C7F|nr:hypothetical protein [Leuconostoc pseudomesenteroides]TOZ07370.1 hypothetical protein DIS14_02295 [Leuconostoc pseudomesenteroides]
MPAFIVAIFLTIVIVILIPDILIIEVIGGFLLVLGIAYLLWKVFGADLNETESGTCNSRIRKLLSQLTSLKVEKNK